MKSIFLISLLILSSTASFLYSNSNNPLPPHLRFLNSIKNPKIITNSLEEIFTEAIEKFNIKFSSIDDFNEKKEIFKRNYQRISNHNQRYDEGKESYFMDVNQFTHLRDDELRRFNGLKIDENEVKNEFKTFNLNVTAPDAFDWLREGKVSKIQNQGDCGSCYAFSAIAAIESQNLIKYGEYYKLSEQEAMECANGCNGDNQQTVYEYTGQYGGATYLSTYPYYARVINNCSPGSRQRAVRSEVQKYYVVPSGEEEMKKYLSTYGPLDASMKVDNSFMSYAGGIYRPSSCTGTLGGHAILIVGYGSQGGVKYWNVKNSWGTTFGENGFFRILRGYNTCNIEKSNNVFIPLI